MGLYKLPPTPGFLWEEQKGCKKYAHPVGLHVRRQAARLYASML